MMLLASCHVLLVLNISLLICNKSYREYKKSCEKMNKYSYSVYNLYENFAFLTCKIFL